MIGVYSKSALVDFFIQNGFSESQNLDINYNDNLNALKLKNNRIDLWAVNNNAGKYIANKLNLEVKKIYSIKDVKLYLIFNKETYDIIIKKLSTSLEKIRKEGYIAKLLKKYDLKD
jgi:ABC-type amino acid transport substrate-binding protein